MVGLLRWRKETFEETFAAGAGEGVVGEVVRVGEDVAKQGSNLDPSDGWRVLEARSDGLMLITEALAERHICFVVSW